MRSRLARRRVHSGLRRRRRRPRGPAVPETPRPQPRICRARL